MLLASVKDIRDPLGFDDMTDINDAIKMALNAAEPQIAARLNTTFTRGEHTDTFWVPEPTIREPGVNRTEFRLTYGMVTEITSATATNNPMLFSDAQQADLGSVLVWNKEKGVGRDWKTAYYRQTVEIKYTYGFEPSADDAGSYKLDQVPKWLQEAARILALIHLSSQPALTEAEIKLDSKMLTAQYEALIKQHIRYAPMALLPM